MVQFTSSQRQMLEGLLRQKIAQLRQQIAVELRSSGDTDGIGLANHIQEVDDQAVADLETALDIAGLERHFRDLRASIEALARLDTPEFGVCPDCSGAIALSRLEADPSVRRCVTCQSHTESLRGGKSASL